MTSWSELLYWLGPRNHRVMEPCGFDIRHHKDYIVAMHTSLSLGSVIWWKDNDYVGVRLPLVVPRKRDRKILHRFLRDVLPAPWGISWGKTRWHKGWTLWRGTKVERFLSVTSIIVFTPEDGYYFVREGAMLW